MPESLIKKPSILMRLFSPFCALVLKASGWHVETTGTTVSKCVLLSVPHTTNWDLFYSLLCAGTVKIPIWFMMKHTHFWWPMGVLWRFLGGVPINRTQSSGVVEQMVEAFNSRDMLYLVIPPEGTRKDVSHWKTGFYHIALQAGVPVWLWYIDYQRKVLGNRPVLYLTGDINADFTVIRNYYESVVGPMPNCRPAPHAAAHDTARQA